MAGTIFRGEARRASSERRQEVCYARQARSKRSYRPRSCSRRGCLAASRSSACWSNSGDRRMLVRESRRNASARSSKSRSAAFSRTPTVPETGRPRRRATSRPSASSRSRASALSSWASAMASASPGSRMPPHSTRTALDQGHGRSKPARERRSTSRSASVYGRWAWCRVRNSSVCQ